MDDDFKIAGENDEGDIDPTATPILDDEEEEVEEDADSPEVPLSKLKDAAALDGDIDPEDLDDEEEEDDMELLGSEDWEE